MKHDSRRAGRVVLTGALAAVLASGCPDRSEDPDQSSAEADAPVEEAPRLRIHRALLSESARAELDVGGLLIDFGTADQHKYTRGGWHTGWGESRVAADGTSFARVAEKRARVVALLGAAPREIVVRLRSSIAGQRVTVLADGRALAAAPVGESWSLVRVAADELGAQQPIEIELAFDEVGADVRLADVDWLWFRGSVLEEPPALGSRVEPVRLGRRTRLALLAPTSRSYSYYLQPPANATLAFFYGSEGEVEFRVRAQTADGEIHELFEEVCDGGAWQRAHVDLADFSERVIRLELTTRGEGERTGWAYPVIAIPPEAEPARAVAAGRRRPENVVFVVMDTTRADAFSMVNPDNEVATPVFDELAESSTTFANAYNAETWTVPSTATILSGVYPRTHRAQKWQHVLPEEVELLPEHLARYGFRTAAISANVFVSEEFGFDQGWGSFVNTAHSERDDAEHVFGDAIRWLAEHGDERPFLLYIQSMDAHTPYRVDRAYTKRYHPESYSGRLGPYFSSEELAGIRNRSIRATDSDMAWIRALYYGEITYQDEHIGKLLSALEEHGLADNTLVVITNDHGEELGDHGGMGHTWSMHEEILRAPLLIHYPPLFPEGLRVEDVVEHADLAPTLVDALGLPPMAHAEGVSLLPLVTGEGGRRRPLYATIDFRDEARAVRVGRWKLIVDAKTGWKSLYDLKEDPGETRDRKTDRAIAARSAEIYLAEALAAPEKLARLRRTAPREQLEHVEADIDDETRGQLEALGYIEGDDK